MLGVSWVCLPWTRGQIAATALVFAVVSVLFYLLYAEIRLNFIREVRSHAMYVASFAAGTIDPELVGRVHTARDMESEAFVKLQASLVKLKRSIQDVSFIYVMRRLEKPGASESEFVYVADLPVEDSNGNGKVDPWERSEAPGTPFDSRPFPSLTHAWTAPDADDEITVDPPYPDSLSGYAPIKDAAGTTVALLGVDIISNTIRDKLLTINVILFLYASIIALLLSAVLLLYLGRSQVLDRIRKMNDELAAKNQRLEESLKIRNDLSHMIVHDIRNPVFVVKGLSELLLLELGPELSPDSADHLKKIQMQADRVMNLLHDMLLTAKQEAGSLVLNRRRTRISGVAESVIVNNEISFSMSKLRVVKAFPASESDVEVDVELMTRVIENLVMNAVKYSPQGGDIGVEVTQTIEAGRLRTSVAVWDCGKGIPDDLKSTLFQKFATGRIKPERGSQIGLGLSFAKLAVDAHSGILKVEDNQPRGARFVVELSEAKPS